MDELDCTIAISEFALRLLPQVLEPPELTVFMTLYSLSWGQNKADCRIAVYDLAKIAKLAASTTHAALKGLKKKGLISARASRNKNVPLTYEVSRDCRDYSGPLPETFQQRLYKASAEDKRVLADAQKSAAPVERQIDLLKGALYERMLNDWLAESRVNAPNLLIKRILADGGDRENRVLRDFFTSMVFGPYIKSLLEEYS